MKTKALLIALCLSVTAGTAAASCSGEQTMFENAYDMMVDICAGDGSGAACVDAVENVTFAQESYFQCMYRETQSGGL